jgi:hypothetical protein
MWKLLIIEPFSHENLIKLELKIVLEFGVFLVLLKSP